jgi:hypothetical protein
MRRMLGLVVLWLAVAAGVSAADRQWQTGTWGKAGAARGVTTVRSYAIETDQFQYQVQETVARGAQPLAPAAGASVTFAVEEKTVYVREGDAGERSLRLVKAVRKLKSYGFAGPGHFIKAMGDDGRTLTLEDGSVWEIDERTTFKTVGWEAKQGVTVRASNEEDDFNYFLDNTDADEGALARLVKAP